MRGVQLLSRIPGLGLAAGRNVKGRLRTSTVITALRESRGIVSLAAHKLAVHRSSLYRFIDRPPYAMAMLEDEGERLIDDCEAVLINKALGGDLVALLFTLKCLGKHRGWVERAEVSATFDNGPGAVLILLDNRRDAVDSARIAAPELSRNGRRNGRRPNTSRGG